LGGRGWRYLQGLLQYLQDEHMDKKNCAMESHERWTLVPCTEDTPRQQNGDDCGVFTCLFADLISRDLSFDTFHENTDMSLYREHIARSILEG
jgi:sentrin-specific protease 1